MNAQLILIYSLLLVVSVALRVVYLPYTVHEAS